MTTSTVVIGTQWGDEGKGKICDVLSQYFDATARFNGGPNAGHTVQHGDQRIKLHHLPSGVANGRHALMMPGMICRPDELFEEIKMVAETTGTFPHVTVDRRIHIITERHREIDADKESARGDNKIGTTLTGNGPCYADKSHREGSRLDMAVFDRESPYHKILRDMVKYGLIGDSVREIRDMLDSGSSVLFEGAHGFMLDIDHGSYPYVTSSTCGATGIGMHIDPLEVCGVMKAYSTRIGAGAFLTEIESDAISDYIRERGREYGTTTGRPRRIGWLDLSVLEECHRVNDLDYLALTMVDVLSQLHQFHVKLRNGEWTSFPGWGYDISGVREFQHLPSGIRELVSTIETQLSIPVRMISVGPRTEEVIWRS